MLKKKYDIREGFIDFEMLGKGGLGKVIKVLDKSNHRFAAKKILINETTDKSESFDHDVKAEIEILKKIIRSDDHRLIKIYELNYVPKESFSYTMEFGQGDFNTYLKFRKEKEYPFT
jgi:serine/threonine protein kinase